MKYLLLAALLGGCQHKIKPPADPSCDPAHFSQLETYYRQELKDGAISMEEFGENMLDLDDERGICQNYED